MLSIENLSNNEFEFLDENGDFGIFNFKQDAGECFKLRPSHKISKSCLQRVEDE